MMSNIRRKSLIVSAVLLLCFSCVPDLEVTDLKGKTDGRNPIGLVQIGAPSVFEGGPVQNSTQDKDQYCTAFLLDSGNFMTERHCVQAKDSSEPAEAGNIWIHMKNNKEGANQVAVKIHRVLGSSISEERDYIFLEPENKEQVLHDFSSLFIRTEVPQIILEKDFDLEAQAWGYDSGGHLHLNTVKIRNGLVYRSVVATAPSAGAIPALLKGTFETDQYLWLDMGTQDETLMGAPIVYEGRAIGMVIHGDTRNQASASKESYKMQWFPGVFSKGI
jgi:hypothetical protein